MCPASTLVYTHYALASLLTRTVFMLIATLNRLSSDDMGTCGILTAQDFTCFALELPWRNNTSNLSCIPPGEYVVKWTLSPRLKKYTYEVLGVPNRGGIRIHGGNVAGDTTKGYLSHSLGCPLLGKRIIRVKGQTFIATSGPTVQQFQSYMDKRPFKLCIV